MIETQIRNYLMGKLNKNVYLEIPKNMPDECVVFTIVDRSRENLIDAVTASFYSYAKTNAQACALDESVRQVMQDFDGEYNISSSKLSGGNADQDTTLKRYRYRCYFNVTYMED